MEIIKKIFPYSFREKKDVGALIVTILLHLVVGAIVTALCSIPVVGKFIAVFSGLIDLYLTAGIVFSILHYAKVIK